MNILPKKRWHVRTKDNIARVRRDEANAAAEEKELKRRIQLAEQEARTDLLRKKAKGESTECQTSENSKGRHIDFFTDIEVKGYLGSFNKEHEAEEKAKKEKFEKDIGLLTYLGQSSSEAKGEVPFYLKCDIKEVLTSSDGKEEIASSKHKSSIDPLNDMKKYLALKHKSSGEKVAKPKINTVQEKVHDKQRTCKKLSKLEELRAKRLKRETEEKKRSQQFLENFRKGAVQAEQEVVCVLDDRLRQYNSQFNPHLAKRNLSNKFEHTSFL